MIIKDERKDPQQPENINKLPIGTCYVAADRYLLRTPRVCIQLESGIATYFNSVDLRTAELVWHTDQTPYTIINAEVVVK